MYVAPPFKSHSQPAKLMQPTQRAFDDPSMYAQATAMGSAPLCQHWRDVEASQLLAKWLRVISPVSLQFMRPSSWPPPFALHRRYRLHQGKGLGDIVSIGSSHYSGKRDPLSISDHMVFAPCLGLIGGVRSCQAPPKQLSVRRCLLRHGSNLCDLLAATGPEVTDASGPTPLLAPSPAVCASKSFRCHNPSPVVGLPIQYLS